MSDNFINAMVAVVSLIIGLATVAVIVSRSANTSGVIQAASSGLAADIGVAVSPVTGSSGSGAFGGFGIGSLGITGGSIPVGYG